jgi:hypothetical protein
MGQAGCRGDAARITISPRYSTLYMMLVLPLLLRFYLKFPRFLLLLLFELHLLFYGVHMRRAMDRNRVGEGHDRHGYHLAEKN